jgi:hypothetical protein
MLELHVSFTYNITGNAGVGGAVLSYTDGAPKTVTADGNGLYTIPVPSGWSGTVTPSKPGYTFSPAGRAYSTVSSHLAGQDYTATAIPPDGYEADNTPEQAKAISPGSPQTHNITPAADVDWVKFTLNTASAISLETSGTTPADTQIGLYASSDLVNPYGFNNDKDGANRYSYLAYDCAHALPAGTYYVRIDEANNDSEIPEYQIKLTATGCFSTASFNDVPANYWAGPFVERLYAAGITGGCGTNPLRYCPEETVTRAQMAVFLLRGIHTSAYAPPAIGPGSGFGDVPIDYWSGAWIKQLAAEGITTGCGNGNYCPEHPVTRAQMAVFLLRSKYGASYTPPGVGAGTGFGDVPPNYWSAAWIKQLVTEGITAGCGSGNYCPENPVTRAQMAVFLVRTFSLP